MFNRIMVVKIVIGCLFFILISCGKISRSTSGTIPDPLTPIDSPRVFVNEVDYWLTTSDQSSLLSKQPTKLTFGTVSNSFPFIQVDSAIAYQTVDGFGFTLTGGSAFVINKLSTSDRANLLSELFGIKVGSIGISYLRISIGASDLNAAVFSYDDIPSGQTDLSLDSFSLSQDKKDLIPLLREIVAINPSIKILATPWSPPLWMKDNGKSMGGSLQVQYYDVYANYFVKYIQQMKAEGITIDAITPQNEPLHPGNNPSLLMLAEQQRDFIKNNLGPAFRVAGITTKIIAYDHNCDHPDYPISVLNDAAASDFVDGAAFHLYAGDITALSTLHNAFPTKNVYFTEQWTSSEGNFGGDLIWHVKNVIIGSMRNWSKVALEWNLANDPDYSPHTSGGCTQCKGALTIGSNVIRNVAYYIIAHASKFVPAGSVRISSSANEVLQNVAFKTPDGKKVLIVSNGSSASKIFNIKFNNRWVTTNLVAGGVGTYIW